MSNKPQYAGPLGPSILLSASVPDKNRAEVYRRGPDSHIEIEEAVISLARAVLAAGGTLVFGGHPSIAHLISQVAVEYLPPMQPEMQAETQSAITIYQSKVFEDVVPQATRMMFDLHYAKMRWVEAVNGEVYVPGARPHDPGYPQQSLQRMRTDMIVESRAQAMVCIGGMEGVEEEALMFHELLPKARVYAIVCTGGAAMIIAQRYDFVRAIDDEILDRLETPRSLDSDTERPEKRGHLPRPYVPYPVIMQEIVREMSKDGSLD